MSESVFDRAIYYGTIGYELTVAERAIPEITAKGETGREHDHVLGK